MDSGVHSAVTNGLNMFKVDAITLFNEVIPIALAVLITITVVYFAIRKFEQLAGLETHESYTDRHYGKGAYDEMDEEQRNEVMRDWTPYD